MGEAKRKKEAMSDVERLALQVSHELANQGRVIAGGFAAYRVLNELTEKQVELVEDAFYAGADHVLMTLMAVLDPGPIEPTNRDIQRLDKIMSELNTYRELAKLRYAKADGSA